MVQITRLEEAKFLLEIGSVYHLTNKINEIINETQRRNKLIRSAGRPDAGWLTEQGYIPNELTSNSDDSRKMRNPNTKASSKKQKCQENHHSPFNKLHNSSSLISIKTQLSPIISFGMPSSQL